MGVCDDCVHHSDHASRITRSEEDIQRLFDKLGAAIGLMSKIDKRLEGLYGKITGIAMSSSLLITIILKVTELWMK